LSDAAVPADAILEDMQPRRRGCPQSLRRHGGRRTPPRWGGSEGRAIPPGRVARMARPKCR